MCSLQKNKTKELVRGKKGKIRSKRKEKIGKKEKNGRENKKSQNER